MSFAHRLARAVKAHNSLLCIGLDPDISKLPPAFNETREPFYTFNRALIDATSDVICAYKLNSAFYEAEGTTGIEQLRKTCKYLRDHYAHIPVILDFKRGDIGNTNSAYAAFAFSQLDVDAVTIHPYMGREANEPFLNYKSKGIFVLCRTSNPGAGEFQDITVKGKKLYQIVAKQVMEDWNKNDNCHLVMGAPYPAELSWARRTLGEEVIFLVPGAGPQGGEVSHIVKAGLNKRGEGVIVNSSREVIYASHEVDFAQAARRRALQLRDEINAFRQPIVRDMPS